MACLVYLDIRFGSDLLAENCSIMKSASGMHFLFLMGGRVCAFFLKQALVMVLPARCRPTSVKIALLGKFRGDAKRSLRWSFPSEPPPVPGPAQVCSSPAQYPLSSFTLRSAPLRLKVFGGTLDFVNCHSGVDYSFQFGHIDCPAS